MIGVVHTPRTRVYRRSMAWEDHGSRPKPDSAPERREDAVRPPTGHVPSDPRFAHPRYVLRRKFLKVFGGAFHVFDEQGGLVFYADQKAFKLKEDIRLYGGEDKIDAVLSIQARKVIDWRASYDVTDPATGTKVGALRRKGLRSELRDEWVILDAQEQEIGRIQEDSLAAALVRRFVAGWLLPQTFHLTVADTEVARFQQRFNPFVQQIELDFTYDPNGRLDRRIGIAAAVLLSAIEGRQG